MAAPSFGVKVNATVQDEETSSCHVAKVVSPILSSLPETVTAGALMTFTELWDIVMVGAVLSWGGSSGVTGVGGVGSTGSSPPQEIAMDTPARNARKRMSRFPVRPGMTDVWLDQRIYPMWSLGPSADGDMIPGIRTMTSCGKNCLFVPIFGRQPR